MKQNINVLLKNAKQNLNDSKTFIKDYNNMQDVYNMSLII